MSLVRSVVANWTVLRHLTIREIRGRYRHSLLGGLWAFFNPLGMLALYTLAFGYFLGLRWEGMTNTWDFGVALFGGLCVYNFTVECLTRSSSLMQQHSGFVRKMVFPLELLPVSIFAAAVFHALIAVGLWTAAVVCLHGLSLQVGLTIILCWVPVLFFGLGLTFATAVIGTFFRDFEQLIVFIAQALLFLSPIFYPLAKLGVAGPILIWVNPIAFTVDALRSVTTDQIGPSILMVSAHLAGTIVFSTLAFAIFQKSRDWFADSE